MKKKSMNKAKIPEFKTYEEEARFWDTHNVTDFDDETEDVEIVFDKNMKIVYESDQPREETIVLRVQKSFKDELAKIARSKGLNLSTLARMWLWEKAHNIRS